MGVPQLERYEVIDEIGQGGMSIVYRARDRQLNRIVALKVLHDFLARQEESRRRFHREAVAVAKLHHPGIVEIFDYSGPDAKQSYIVCELIDGRTLRKLVEDEGPLPHPELAALVTAELTRALRHAHEQGIIHRDLKPENIMVTKSGHLKLMDFGIAQIMGGATRLTATGTLLGSPAHMAPEMIDGHPCDHRGDIFSLGTILYWLATGTLPFDAPNPSALFRQILQGDYEPPQAVQPRVGNGLSRIIDRALAIDPNERYQDISELQADLNRELEPVDLLPVDTKARAYLTRPRPYADTLRPRLVEHLVRAGKQALQDGNVGRAMDRFNRVLAVEPEHSEVLALVRKVGRRQALSARLRQAAVVAIAILGLAGLGMGVYGLGSETDDPMPLSKAIGRSAVGERDQGGDSTTDNPGRRSGGDPSRREALNASANDSTVGGDVGAETNDDRRPRRPSAGRAGDPVAGRTATGRAGDPATGRAGDPAPGRTGDPATGRTGDPATGRTGDPATGRTGDPAPGRTGDPATSASTEGRTGNPTGLGRPPTLTIARAGNGSSAQERRSIKRRRRATRSANLADASVPMLDTDSTPPLPLVTSDDKPAAPLAADAILDPGESEVPLPDADTRYPLLLRMHPGWANVSLNGKSVAEGAYRAKLRLPVGENTVVISNQYGQRPPRTIEVSENGRMTERRPDGSRVPILGELPIYTPGPAVSDRQ